MDELEIIQHTQFPGMSLFFDTVDYRTPHVHPELELLLILDESLVIGNGLQHYRAEPGQMVLLQPNQVHEFYKEKNRCTLLCIQVAPSLLAMAFPGLSRICFGDLLPHSYLSREDMEQIHRDFLEMARGYLTRKEGYELFCVGKLALMLHLLLQRVPHHIMSREETRNRDRKNDRLSRLIEFVNQNYMHKIRLTDFAEQEHLSLNYLSGFIKETLNQNFQEYVNTVRFNAACKQIGAGKDNLIDVCMNCGFSDYRYFSRTFRTKLGMTPAEYQRQQYPAADQPPIRRSLHSMEQFYSREQSLELCDRYEKA